MLTVRDSRKGTAQEVLMTNANLIQICYPVIHIEENFHMFAHTNRACFHLKYISHLKYRFRQAKVK